MTADPLATGSDRAWSWRREGPWILLPLVLALTFRADAVAGHEAFLDSDNALTPLMGTMIARGGYVPLMCDGQDYLGALDAYLASPLQAMWPDRAIGFALSQLVALAAVVGLGYPLLFAVGGRAGALAGSAAIALGSAEQLKLTVLPPIGYLTNLVFAIAVLHAGLACRRAPTLLRCAVVGLACGAGYWNNPQVAPFAGAVIVAAWAEGALLRWRTDQRAPGQGPARCALALVAAGALALGVVLVLPTAGPMRVGLPFGFDLSLGRPEKYFPRALAFTAVACWLAELVLARARLRLAAMSAAFATGAGLGLAPLALHHALGRTAGVSAWMQFKLNQAIDHLPQFVEQTGLVVLGTPAWKYEGPFPTWHAGLQVAVGLGLFATLIALLVAHRGWFAGLARGRTEAVPLALYLVLPAVLLTAICLMRGGAASRYALAYSLPIAALVAWAVGAAWSSGQGAARAIVGLALATGALHAGLEHRHLEAWVDGRRGDDGRTLVRRLGAAGLTGGYGQYWTAVRLTLVSGERFACGVVYDAYYNYRRFPGHKAHADRVPTPVEVFDLGIGEDPGRLRGLLEGGELDPKELAARGGPVDSTSIAARWGTRRYVAFQRLRAVDSPPGRR